jgi:hypothetical protein
MLAWLSRETLGRDLQATLLPARLLSEAFLLASNVDAGSVDLVCDIMS